ncbi:CHRD domain-containing protein [Nocardioides perillae]|uniref:CHRD domain-containing protein n=1 Tax=Nocardioides perillae TaxID=1119534 RepID=A0A7Y9RWG4_9ACTN|nr:hypothetical protein [Nocardioides perillae]
MNPSRKALALAGTAAVVLGGAAALSPVGPASAGHTNTVVSAELDGRSEVGSSRAIAGDPNGTGSAYVFGVDGDPRTLCYVLEVDKIGQARAAHIHRGEAGSNGPVVAFLAAPGDGDAADCLTEGEPGKFADGQTVADILENPEEYYVNVHNDEYPGGAVRGQLVFEQ